MSETSRDGRRTPSLRLASMLLAALLLISGIAIGALTDQPSAAAVSGNPGPAEANGHTVTVDLTAEETVQTLVPAGPGVTPVDYHVWTFSGTAPGPVIRVQLGDTIEFNLTNDSSIGMQHSIDFHAAMTPWADLPEQGQEGLTGNYQPVNPGETKSFTWTAMYPGAFLYHCGVPPVLQHISNGMYGAIIVEPPDVPAEREYVLVQSEFYPGAKPIDGVYEGDLNSMLAAKPSYVVWNGVADQYKATPLEAKPNEPFRVWVVNAGPTLTSAFHVIGTLFDAYADGNPANPLYGMQTYNVPPGGGGMFELNIPDPGLYPFVTHAFAYTGLGSVGLIKIDPNAPDAPGSYPTMGDPFSAGVKAFAAPANGGAGNAGSMPAGMASMTPMEPPTSDASAAPSAAGSGATSEADCTPSGSTIRLAADASVFDATCIAAPAGEPFKIVFANNDPGIPHNVSIYTDESATTVLYQGKTITGPDTVTYKVDPLDAGTYFFRCDVHPTTMTGTVVVK